MANIVHTYYDLYKEKSNFRRVDHTGAGRYDNPAALYFKLAFYFSDDVGLLGCNGYDLESVNELEKEVKSSTKAFKDKDDDGSNTNTSVKKRVYSNTALNYLLLNDELERAELLKKFIALLSSINCDSPWYFKEINGIDGALERKFFSPGEELKIEDKPRQITIKCLADAYDNRIGTLLDLYRAICYSYQAKREVVPANLRKFNMAIMIFNAPIFGLGGKAGTEDNRLRLPQKGDEESMYIPSMKYIEFRNCEFDYNSAKSAFATLNAEEPFEPEYTITINYDDAYEVRYNEIMQKVITDFIMIDILAERENNNLSDINTHGIVYDDGTQSKELDKGPLNNNMKWVWVNRNWRDGGPFNDSNETPYYTIKTKHNAYEQSEMINLDALGGFTNMIGSKMKAFQEKLNKLGKLPSSKIKPNIHDQGTVNNFGIYEYLNRFEGTDGLVGDLASQGVGAGAKTLKDNVNKLFLGNIYGTSVSNIMSAAERALSGDISGSIAKAIRDNSGRKNDYEGNLKGDIFPEKEKTDTVAEGILPQHDYKRTSWIGKYNEAKSIYQNL